MRSKSFRAVHSTNHTLIQKSRGKRNRGRFLTLENLEGRSLMAMLVADVLNGTADTTISGTVYEDLNSNGIRDNGENGIKNWQVYLDLDNSGTLNTDAVGTPEPSALTNKDGDFVINKLMPGNYRVGEVVVAGWTPTSPVSQDVTVVKSKDTKTSFLNFSGGEIAGAVWNDLSADGVRDPGENGLADWTVFLDLNNDGLLDTGEPSTLTDANGGYSFSNLPPGDYEVTEVLPAGWEVSPTFDIKQTAGVLARQQVLQDFANFSTTNGSIQGVIWNDTNANGIRETDPTTGEFTEPGSADWTVFIDVNNDGVVDSGEPTALTDANGNYTFVSLVAGDYEVTEVLPAGWNVSPTFDVRQTVAVRGGEASVAGDFANFTILNGSIQGTVWNDINRNGLRDINALTGVFSDPGLANWTILLDLNRNGNADVGEPTTLTDLNGQYFFVDLQVGDYEVQEFVPSGWEVAATFNDNNTVTVYSGVDSVAPDFANYNVSAASPGSVSGVVWNDINGNGQQDTGDTGLADWTVFVDLNADGVLTAGESFATTAADGSYSISGITPGSIRVVTQATVGWHATAPSTNIRSLALRSNEAAVGLDFGEAQLKDSSISGTIFADTSKDGVRTIGERGLAGITVYLDLNNNGALDAGEPEATTSSDLFYTPDVDEAGSYSFTHLAKGTYIVRENLPATLSATPAAQLEHVVTIVAAEDRRGIDTAAVFRPNEIHGTRFEDANGNHARDTGETGLGGVTVYVDLNRNNLLDATEPTTTTNSDGTYSFTNLSPGAYVIREFAAAGYSQTSPTTVGGILWPTGVSNPAVGNVSPTSMTMSLAIGESHRETVSLTMPKTGALTDLVDVFMLFDDTGSFTNNSPIIQAAFPDIISRLQSSLTGINLGFGVGRFEEYANYAFEYNTGRPFILNQPIVAASTTGYMSAIQSALNRTTPGYGGDQPETDLEALYQLVTGKGFDGNNNGSVLDSGAAGLAATQLNPGSSGDVPSFASFTADPTNGVLKADGTVGGAGFRAGALPIVLLATDTGFAYQPKGETTITGVGGTSLPLTSFTETSRPDTPFNSGAGIQETITALNSLGALVIGLGTNPESTFDPRQGLEAISRLTGATNRSSVTIENGTADPIAPGDPFYFQIASGFGASVADGVVNAIQNAVTNVAVDITIQASDPRIHIINHTGVKTGVGAAQIASFDFEIIGDGTPHRFDLQFVRAGTNVVLGSIPVVIGTPISGDGYEFEDLEDGEISSGVDFGDQRSEIGSVNVQPTFVKGADVAIAEDAGVQTIPAWATAINAGNASESGQVLNFIVSNDHSSLFSQQPTITADGTLTFVALPNAFGTSTVSVQLHDNGGTANGGVDTSSTQVFTISVSPVNDSPAANSDFYTTAEDVSLTIPVSGVLTNDSDVEGDPLTAVLVTGPNHGALALNTDGSFTYTPAANFNGSDSFTYQANDGTANSNIVTVSITIAAVNDAPVAAGDAFTTSEDTPLSAAGLLANDVDVDGDALVAILVAGPSHGSLSLHGDGSFVYTPAGNYAGDDSFTYKVNDGVADSIPVTVAINVLPVNDAPVAVADSYTSAENAAIAIPASGLLGNDSDVENDPLTAWLVTGPNHGVLLLNTDGSFNYSPNPNYNGADNFSYRANDGTTDSNVVDVNITVTPVNQPPIATDDAFTTAEDNPLSLPALGVLTNDTDIEGDPLTAILVAGPSHGTLTLNPNGSFSYTPVANYAGTDSFSYRANDGTADSNIATVNLTVTAVNDAPTAVGEFYVISEDTTLSVAGPGLLVNDSDVEGDPLQAILVSGASHGTLTLNANGSFSYSPFANYNGPDSFAYQANDGALNSNVVMVNLTVTSVNDAPVGSNDAYSSQQGTVLTVPAGKGVLTNDRDADGNPLQAILAAGPTNGSLTLNTDGSFTYAPNASFAGTDSFTYRANDGLLDSGLITVFLSVTPVAPTGETKFIVVDATTRSTYNYDAAGNSVVQHRLNKEDEKPRGVASNKDGSLYWVVDQKGQVFVHNQSGRLVGTWECKGIDKPEGIATNGKDLWIVDNETDRVYFFAGGAARRTGSATANSSFALSKANSTPKDITTDGVHLWVVNDAARDKVFRYSTRGALEGSWQIDTANSTPTGLTIDPNNVNHLWIVDAGTDRVYEYTGAASRISGQQSAPLSFALNSADGDPQGIADPKAIRSDSHVAVSTTLVGTADRHASRLVSHEQKSPVVGLGAVAKTRVTSPAQSVSKKSTEHEVWDHALHTIAANNVGKHESLEDTLDTLAMDQTRSTKVRK